MGRKECGFLPLAPAPLPSAQETVISPLKGFHLGTSFNSKLSSLTWSSNKGQELLGRRAMANLDSVLKSTDTTLRTKVHKVKAMVFPVVMYRCESWTIKKAARQGIDALELRCCRRFLRVPWTSRRSSQSILKEISPEYSSEGLMLKLKLHSFGHFMRRVDSLEKTLILEKIEGRRRKG